MSSTPHCLEIGSSCNNWLSKHFGFLQIVDWSWLRLEAVAACGVGNRNMIELAKMGVPLDYSLSDIRVQLVNQDVRAGRISSTYNGHHLRAGTFTALCCEQPLKVPLKNIMP